EIRFVRWAEPPKMVQNSSPTFHVVHIAIRKPAFFEKPAILLFDDQEEPIKISAILVMGGRFLRFINNPELDMGRFRSIDAGQPEQFVTHRLKHPLFSPMEIIALLNIRAKA